MPNVPAVSPIILPGHAGLKLRLKVRPQVSKGVADNGLPGVVFPGSDGSRDACRHRVAGSVPGVLILPALLVRASTLSFEARVVDAPLTGSRVERFPVFIASSALHFGFLLFRRLLSVGAPACLAVRGQAVACAAVSSEELRRSGLADRAHRTHLHVGDPRLWAALSVVFREALAPLAGAVVRLSWWKLRSLWAKGLHAVFAGLAEVLPFALFAGAKMLARSRLRLVAVDTCFVVNHNFTMNNVAAGVNP